MEKLEPVRSTYCQTAGCFEILDLGLICGKGCSSDGEAWCRYNCRGRVGRSVGKGSIIEEDNPQ